MLTNLITTNVIRLPDGTERVAVISISSENSAWTTTDYLWLAVLALFAIWIFYPLVRWIYKRRRAPTATGKK